MVIKPLPFFLHQDPLEYRKKVRLLKVRMLDNTVKSLMVDDSQSVGNLMVIICTKIGITNHDEYSLVWDKPEENQGRRREERGRDLPDGKEHSKLPCQIILYLRIV